jgi:hypothetical protein
MTAEHTRQLAGGDWWNGTLEVSFETLYPDMVGIIAKKLDGMVVHEGDSMSGQIIDMLKEQLEQKDREMAIYKFNTEAELQRLRALEAQLNSLAAMQVIR